MINYCERIEKAVGRFGNSFSDFINDTAYRDSVSMCVLQIGELTTHLTNDFKQKYSQVPWREIVGMRNHFAHGYIEMNNEQIWKTVREDIPEIKAFCQSIFDEVY
ncbi:MAG: DUF86 domain-containing protein [Firmicutes bacterium]|nr:DUF86 domain-containing protein [Bacillota bacterium]